MIPLPMVRRPAAAGRELTVHGAREHNLRNLTVQLPARASSSRSPACPARASRRWSTTSCYAVLANQINGARMVPGRHTRVTGLDQVDKVVGVDQSPIGRTPRSNPATYTGVFDQHPQAVRGDHRGEGARVRARAGSRSTSRAAGARTAPATARSRSR